MSRSKTFADNLKRFREMRGWTQEELAERAGMKSQGRIGNYERDSREPKLDDIDTLAETLGVTVPELLGVEGPAQDMRDIASALVAMCDLLGESMPRVADDLARRIVLLAGGDPAPHRLAAHLLARLQQAQQSGVKPS